MAKLNRYKVTFPETEKYEASYCHVHAPTAVAARQEVAAKVGCDPSLCTATKAAKLSSQLAAQPIKEL